MRMIQKKRLGGALLLAGLVATVVSVPVLGQPVCTQPFMYTVSENDDMLRVVELASGTVIDQVQVEFPGFTVTGCSGVAIEPGSGIIYLLIKTDQMPPLDEIPFLATFDIDSGIASNIGPTLVDFGSLTFDSTGVLYAISADTASPPRAFCELSLVTGSPTDLCRQPAGEDGEAIAIGPMDLRYHASGVSNAVFDLITDTAPFDCVNTSIDISGTPLQGAAMTAITWFESENAFLWKQAGTTEPLYLVTETGDVTPYANLDHPAKGMAVFELVVPCPMDCFIRGDVDGDTVFSGLVDALYLLNWQFSGGPNPPCLKAGDADDDGTANGLVDSLYILNFQFAGGPMPPAPFPIAGQDPTADNLTCDTTLPCP